jgi:8-oxo-dGTP pyrophosphatase MutT (NUDIX family)
MNQGDKIYFDERVALLSSKITKSFEKNDGLFYKYQKKEELIELLESYEKLKEIKTLYILHDNVDQLFEIIKSCFTIVEAAGGIIRNKDGQVLAILRRGKWDLPKGKVEKGEFYKQTALREVKEECGLTELEIINKITETYHVYREHNIKILKRTIWYEMQLTSDQQPVIQTEENITDYKWVDYKGLNEIMKNTYESLKDIFIGINYKDKS